MNDQALVIITRPPRVQNCSFVNTPLAATPTSVGVCDNSISTSHTYTHIYIHVIYVYNISEKQISNQFGFNSDPLKDVSKKSTCLMFHAF